MTDRCDLMSVAMCNLVTQSDDCAKKVNVPLQLQCQVEAERKDTLSAETPDLPRCVLMPEFQSQDSA